MHLAPLLFPQAGMHGVLTDLAPTAMVADTLGGRDVLRVTGESTGRFGPARPTTAWVDAASHLLLKLVEDTPRGSPGGSVDRITTTFTPEANLQMDDSRFVFDVPRVPPR